MNLPPFENFPVISDNKIVMRQILDSDINHIIEISYYDSIKATTIAEATEMQVKINRDYLRGNSVHWGIAIMESNKIIGTCGYYRGFNNDKGELGCVLLPEFQGKGYMTSAMHLAIDFGFNSIGLNKIIAITSKQNLKAIRLMERLGFARVQDPSHEEVRYELTKYV